MRKVFVALSYGQGGGAVDRMLNGGVDGVQVMAERLRAAGAEVRVFQWYEGKEVVKAIADLPASTAAVIAGVSLGANEAPRNAANLSGRTIELLFGIQASEQGGRNAVESNVARAVSIYVPGLYGWLIGWVVGLGHYRWELAPGNRKTSLEYRTTYAPHPGDNLAWVHDLLVAEVGRIQRGG